MWHVGYVQQQPDNGSTYHSKLALVASEDLTNLDQYRFDSNRGSVVVVGCVLGP